MTHNIPFTGTISRSSRLGNKKQVDYNKLATGGKQFTTEGSTPPMDAIFYSYGANFMKL